MMAWLVGAAMWLLLIAASHGLPRLVVLAAPVAWLVWRSQQRAGAGPHPRQPRARGGWDDQPDWTPGRTRTSRWPADQPGRQGWPSGRRPGRGGWPAPGWGAGGAAAVAGPEWDPELDPDFDPELGIDPETGMGWGPVGPGPGDHDGWDPQGWYAPNGSTTRTRHATQHSRPRGRVTVAPDLVIATTTLTGTAYLRDQDGQAITMRLQVRGPGNHDLEAVCRQAISEAATKGNWWLEAWQPTTPPRPGGREGAR